MFDNLVPKFLATLVDPSSKVLSLCYVVYKICKPVWQVGSVMQ